MRGDRRAPTPGTGGFTVVEILVVLLLLLLAVWLARLAYRALVHHAGVRPQAVRLVAAYEREAPRWTSAAPGRGPLASGGGRPAAAPLARAPGRSWPP